MPSSPAPWSFESVDQAGLHPYFKYVSCRQDEGQPNASLSARAYTVRDNTWPAQLLGGGGILGLSSARPGLFWPILAICLHSTHKNRRGSWPTKPIQEQAQSLARIFLAQVSQRSLAVPRDRWKITGRRGCCRLSSTLSTGNHVACVNGTPTKKKYRIFVMPLRRAKWRTVIVAPYFGLCGLFDFPLFFSWSPPPLRFLSLAAIGVFFLMSPWTPFNQSCNSRRGCPHSLSPRLSLDCAVEAY